MASIARRAPRELGYRGRQVLAYIRVCIAEQGRAPSYGEIVQYCDFCGKGNVAHVIHGLERRGLLRRVGTGRVRRIRLAD